MSSVKKQGAKSMKTVSNLIIKSMKTVSNLIKKSMKIGSNLNLISIWRNVKTDGNQNSFFVFWLALAFSRQFLPPLGGNQLPGC